MMWAGFPSKYMKSKGVQCIGKHCIILNIPLDVLECEVNIICGCQIHREMSDELNVGLFIATYYT